MLGLVSFIMNKYPIYQRKDLFRIESDGKYGVVNSRDVIVIRPVYKYIEAHSDYIIAKGDNRLDFFIINDSQYFEGEVIHRFRNAIFIEQHFPIGTPTNGLKDICVYYPNTSSFLGAHFSCLKEFNNGFAICRMGGYLAVDINGESYIAGNPKYGIISTAGRQVKYCIYNKLFPEHEERYIFNRDDKYGILYREGWKESTNQYDGLKSYFEGFAAAAKIIDGEKKWGYIDKDENVVIPYKYDGAFRFQSGKAIVYEWDAEITIDKLGNEIKREPFDYREAYDEYERRLVHIPQPPKKSQAQIEMERYWEEQQWEEEDFLLRQRKAL